MDSVYFICEDVLVALEGLPSASVDVVVTSPPYNLGADYGPGCDDSRSLEEYLSWLNHVFAELGRVLKPEGAFFLNAGWSPKEPWLSRDIAEEAATHFTLQNRIAWVKSIALGDEPCRGHVKPINSVRFLNRQWEEIYHFTKTGEIRIERLAVGVPYADPTNLERGTRGKNGNLRCRGDVLFAPYETVSEDKGHPCPFPVQLAEYCLKLHGVRDDLLALDPFAGIGSTGVAARNLGVRAILIDNNEGYIRIARRRCGILGNDNES